jgi:hypothetical protein
MARSKRRRPFLRSLIRALLPYKPRAMASLPTVMARSKRAILVPLSLFAHFHISSGRGAAGDGTVQSGRLQTQIKYSARILH